MDEPILTARLRMRPWESDDAEALFAVFEPPEVRRWIGIADLEKTRETIAAHRAHQAEHGFSQWAVEERATGELVGEHGLQLLEMKGPETEIGWVLAPHVWGRGYATEAGRAWLDIAFTTLGLDEVIATIRPENLASANVAGRLGMKREERRHVYEAEHDIYVARAVR
jgi:[ribosomal protein S5]-alanine N-acetyltransferase